MRDAGRADGSALDAALDADLDAVLGRDGATRFRERWRTQAPIGRQVLATLYPDHDPDELSARIEAILIDAAVARRASLRDLDAVREVRPTWFQDPDQIGYVMYADRFGGTLDGVRSHLDHLSDLHVSYVHLMNVLRARDGENDGGYAIVDYGDVETRLGSRDDLVRLADDLHARGMSLCIDLVLNHTAAEHAWARAAQQGSGRHRAYYHVFDDRTEPDRYETSLPEVFPEMAPGNFTWDEHLQGWVWTTFNTYQWDLNYANPDVVMEMLGVMLDLANLGVDVLRVDAIAFTWKRMGTNCQNQPEAHLLAQLFRAYVSVAAPGVLLKAEAIVAPGDLVQYLGAHRLRRAECHIAYHNQLMVMIWNCFATNDARLAVESLAELPPTPPDAGWVSYLRCHDDIGWAVDDDIARRVGVDPQAHRAHLAAFYRGDAPQTFALGAPFSSNPAAADERTCGTAASLAGIERARRDGDAAQLDLAVRRLLLGYEIVASFGGIPLVYMGDEIAMTNDWSYLDVPEHAGDSRWLHRPRMDWDGFAAAAPESVERRVFEGMRHLLDVRRRTPAIAGGGATYMHRHDRLTVLAYERRHPVHGRFYGIANIAPTAVSITVDALAWAGIERPVEVLGGDVRIDGPWLRLGPLAMGWFVDARDGGLEPPPPPTPRPSTSATGTTARGVTP